MIGAAGVLFVVVAVGAECLAMWLMVGILASDAVEVLGASGGLAEGVSELTMGIPEGVSGGLAAGVSGLPEFPVGFLATVPARGILCAVVYVCFVLWYWFAGRSDSEIPSEFLNQSEKFKVKSESRSADGGGLRYAEVGGAVEGAAEASAVGVPTAAAQECIERVTVRGAGGRIEVIGVGEIVYLQAEGDYVAIVTESGRWLKEGTMKAFEEVLPRDRFVRVHRSYIVAVGHISRIETSGREHVLVLRGVSARGGGSGAGLRGGGGSGGGSIRISEGGYRLLKGVLGL
jgi:hypothetical protein